MTKSYFVILWEEEIEAIKGEVELAVYRSVKSHCSNGKTIACLSYRDIQNRTTLSFGSVVNGTHKLIKKGFLSVVGTSTRRGGTSNIYKCSLADHFINGKRSLSDHLNGLSDQLVKSSDQSLGTKSYKVKSNNKSNTELSSLVATSSSKNTGAGGLEIAARADFEELIKKFK